MERNARRHLRTTSSSGVSRETSASSTISSNDDETKMDLEEDRTEEVNLEDLTVEELNKRANPKQSIFDDKIFDSVEENLEYMRKKFNFTIPDLQYVSDIEGLVKYCSAKVRLGRICLYCNKQFRSVSAVQQHCRDMLHCRFNVGNINDFFDEYYEYYEWPQDEAGMVVENEDGTTSTTKQATVEVLQSGEIMVTGKMGSANLLGRGSLIGTTNRIYDRKTRATVSKH